MAVAEDPSLAQHPYRGLVHALFAILAALLLTSICWCLWAWIAHRRLQAQIDAITALGQPFWEKDFATQKIPDDQNAAILWKAVFVALPANDTCPSGSNVVFNDYPPFPPQWQQMEDRSIADNAALFDLAHRAAAHDADWSGGNFYPLRFPYFNPSRQTANILGDAILHAHLHGNDALAAQRAADLFRLARADAQVGTLLGRLVSIGIEALGTDRLLCITPDLVVEGDPSNSSTGSTGVRRKDIESLIITMLDENEDRRMRLATVDDERMIGHQMLQDEKKQRWTLGPLVDLSEARSLTQRRVDRLAAAASDEAAATTVYGSNPASVFVSFNRPHSPQMSPTLWAAAYDDLGGSLYRFLDIEWRVAAERRTAAIALAIRLYRVDHQSWPANLAELVPAYLPAIPANPLLSGQSPIGYLIRKNATPDGRDRIMLYFNVAGDPQKATLPPNPSFGWNQWGGQWRDLSRWYPVIPPSASTTQSAP